MFMRVNFNSARLFCGTLSLDVLWLQAVGKPVVCSPPVVVLACAEHHLVVISGRVGMNFGLHCGAGFRGDP